MKTEKPLQPGDAKQPRKPVQPRSIQTREKILDAALVLFCERGYFKTTTNEIARRAGVSIGSLYSYFRDKDTLFFEILERYNAKFTAAKNDAFSQPELLRTDPARWLQLLIDGLIRVHEESRELNRELTVISYYKPEVAEVLERNKRRTIETIGGYFEQYGDKLKIGDPQAAAVAAFDLISSTVDRVTFGNPQPGRERVINAAIAMLLAFFDRVT